MFPLVRIQRHALMDSQAYCSGVVRKRIMISTCLGIECSQGGGANRRPNSRSQRALRRRCEVRDLRSPEEAVIPGGPAVRIKKPGENTHTVSSDGRGKERGWGGVKVSRFWLLALTLSRKFQTGSSGAARGLARKSTRSAERAGGTYKNEIFEEGMPADKWGGRGGKERIYGDPLLNTPSGFA